MCFNISIVKFAEYLEKRFKNLSLALLNDFKPSYYISAFSRPKILIIANNKPNEPQLFQWGLIPFWVKDEATALKISNGTYNARSETLFNLPSFRHAIPKKRCLILVNGFFEWREYNGKKYPYYIKLKDEEIFCFGGIWDNWKNPQTGQELFTVSLITTEANSLMEKIHNTKKRMPLIMNNADQETWLQDISKNDIESLLKPYSKVENMEAYTISKMITAKIPDKNKHELIERFEYPDLPPL